MKYELELLHRNTSSKDLLNDIKRVANKLNKNTVSVTEYIKYGNYNKRTIERRFGSWNKALESADLKIGFKINNSIEDLFKNLENVWISLGRQPKEKEFRQPLSKYSVTPYIIKYGSWYKALEAFVNYINQEQEEESDNAKETKNEIKNIEKEIKRNKREISDRLRFKILLRDGFACKKCGRSPLKTFGVELHVDNIIPWSKGGETKPDNLETKCKECNLGKGNAFNV